MKPLIKGFVLAVALSLTFAICSPLLASSSSSKSKRRCEYPTGRTFMKKLSRVKLLALNVDGVMTNGDIVYSSNGDEMKIFNVKDDFGIKLLVSRGIQLAIISGRKSPIIEKRAKALGIDFVYQEVNQKGIALEEIAEKLSLHRDEVAYIGDDLPDIPALKAAGIAFCPADAVQAVQDICQYISYSESGSGAVREIAELLITAHAAFPCGTGSP